MASQDLLVDMIKDLQETTREQQNELIRIATTISIEIPDIRSELAESERRLKPLEDSVSELNNAIARLNEISDTMKPIVQVFKFVKWLGVGSILIIGWVTSYASGLWELIEKIFKHH